MNTIQDSGYKVCKNCSHYLGEHDYYSEACLCIIIERGGHEEICNCLKYEEETVKKHHPDHVIGWNGSLEELAVCVSNLRYDKLREFINLLSREVQTQAREDFKRQRFKLASKLRDLHFSLEKSSKIAKDLWDFCAPFMR